MDATEAALLARSLGRAVETSAGASLDRALEEVGWGEALAVDLRTSVSTLFELTGSANARCSAIGQVLVAGLGLEQDRGLGVVLPALGCADPPGCPVDGHLQVRGMATADLPDRSAALVVTRSEVGWSARLVDTAALTLRPCTGLDPDLGLLEVTGETVVGPAVGPAPVDWEGATGRCRLALAHELVGAGRAMLELARTHALDRVQFGRPIATFQAVRHHLAETLVAIETAGAVLEAAWEDGSPGTAAMAKALAGRAGRLACRHCQQVLGGIGFTAEHPFHRYVRRSFVLDQLFGAERRLTRALGQATLAHRVLPTLTPL